MDAKQEIVNSVKLFLCIFMIKRKLEDCVHEKKIIH
jgi:hypothetical protein